MAKKQKSFEEKTSSTKGVDLEHIKFVKSVPSDKEGYWRFNESMIALEKGQKLDVALKKMEDEANLVDIEMPTDKLTSQEKGYEQPNQETPVEETPAEESPAEEENPAEEETPTEEEAPAEEETPKEEETPTEKEAPAEEETPTEEEAPAEEDSK